MRRHTLLIIALFLILAITLFLQFHPIRPLPQSGVATDIFSELPLLADAPLNDSTT